VSISILNKVIPKESFGLIEMQLPEKYRQGCRSWPVVITMGISSMFETGGVILASAKAEIRHVFGDTFYAEHVLQ
jgi:hypothetical protein